MVTELCHRVDWLRTGEIYAQPNLRVAEDYGDIRIGLNASTLSWRSCGGRISGWVGRRSGDLRLQ